MTTSIWNTFNEELFGFIKSRVKDTEIAKDILQDVFLKIHSKIDSLKEDTKLTSWVYQITRNTIIDYYRKKKLTISDNHFDLLIPEEEDMEIGIELNACLKPFMNKLPEKYKDALISITYAKLSQKEYAEKNNLSYTAAKSRVQRARHQLKKLFVDCCTIETDKYGNIIGAKEKDCTC